MAFNIADSFFKNMFKPNRLSFAIASDLISVFGSKVRKRLIQISGVQLNMSPSRHLQRDLAKKDINKIMEYYIRCNSLYNQYS